MFIARTDEFEQDTGFGLIFGDAGEIVEDQQMIFVELLDRGFQCEFTAGELQFLHQIGAAGKQYGVLGPNRRKSALVSVDTRCCSEFVGG